MTRLYVVAEGLAEIEFVREVLKPHLEAHYRCVLSVDASKPRPRFTYGSIKKFVQGRLGSRSSDVIVTTMIDLFKIPEDFPGLAEPEAELPPFERVTHLERRFADDISDRRFIPYLQLHEFEALVLCALETLVDYHPDCREDILNLRSSLTGFASPEHVNRKNPSSY
jgi:hypothetical protein